MSSNADEASHSGVKGPLKQGISPLPGVVIGANGVYLGSDMTDSSLHPSPTINEAGPEARPPDPELIETWGVNLKINHFRDGLTPWPHNPSIDESSSPLSTLGHFADNIYKLGPLSLAEYTAQLTEFATVAFPKDMARILRDSLETFLERAGIKKGWDLEKNVWQTAKDSRHTESSEVASWKDGKARDEGWKWELLSDQ